MFRGILGKLQEANAEYEDTVKRIIRQNQDLEELSEELLGEKMSDDIMELVIKQEVVEAISKRIAEAFK